MGEEVLFELPGGGVLQIKAFCPHQLLVSCSSWEIILDAKNTLRRHLITEEHCSLSVPRRPIRILVFSTVRELNKMLYGYELSSIKKDCHRLTRMVRKENPVCRASGFGYSGYDGY